MGFAKLIIIGNLGRGPRLRYTPQGVAICDFTVAVNAKDKGQDATDWYKVTAWGKLAESAARYLVKGAAVYIEGRPKIEEWTSREGVRKFTSCVSVSDIQFLGKESGESEG